MYATHPIEANFAKPGAPLWPKVIAFLLLLLPLASPGVGAEAEPQTTAKALTVTYLGNEGFLLESGGKRVLIDALQGDGIRDYVTLDPIRREILERAQAPFGHMDLILATHYHRDHFNPVSVVRCLASNPSARFVSTEQAASEAMEAAPDARALRSRIRGVHPKAGEKVRVPLDGIGLEVMNLHHGKGSTAQNLGLIVELNGIRILHTGDTQATPAEFIDYGLANEPFQLVFLPFWFLLEPDWSKAVRKAERIVAMHVPALNADARTFGPAGSLAGLKKQLRASDPRVIVFEQILERHTVSLPGSP